jgi:exopolyphosphatase/guanosine-5'-triphosphate,3'-diphosphate pyrophosphatase
MPPETTSSDGRIVGFMDIGTNAVRLLLVRFNPNRSYTILTRQREAVRLGEGEFPEQRLQQQAMHRAVLVCSRFADMARSYGAAEIVAVATSASREADNQRRFLKLLEQKARLDVRVVSGKEEARLIYLGVSSGVNLGRQRALFLDIGGGSTEIAVGDQHQYEHLDTLKLGAIRLTTLFFLPGETDPIPPARYNLVKAYVHNISVRAVQRLRQHKFDIAIGSSGTIVTLAEIAARLFRKRPWRKDDTLSREQLRDVIRMLCSLSTEERRSVPGMNPERADIIIAGAAVLDALMQDLKLPDLRVSERGLRDGLLIEYLSRTEHGGLEPVGFRERSVLQLGRSCGFNEAHGRTVERLALELFDSARELRLHRLGDWQRELLGYSALMHDLGMFLSYDNHNAHSAYVIRNAELLGFDQTEQAIMATTALFHGKALPRKKNPEFAALDKRSREIVRILCIFLRLAESLDRSHMGVVEHARFSAAGRKRAVLEIKSAQDCQLELWGLTNHEKAFAKVFKKNLVIAGPGRAGSKNLE